LKCIQGSIFKNVIENAFGFIRKKELGPKLLPFAHTSGAREYSKIGMLETKIVISPELCRYEPDFRKQKFTTLYNIQQFLFVRTFPDLHGVRFYKHFLFFTFFVFRVH